MRKSWVLPLLLVLWSRLLWALPSPEETERLVHQNIINNFIAVANNPKLYIHQQVIAFRNTHRNEQTPEGGIILPIEKSHLQIMTMNSIWDRQQYCMTNGECVKESYKRILLIALPTKVCDATSCIEDKIYFQMKGGIKTACRSQTSNECFDSTILYMPEEAEILLKE
jgi:hypothetical protein